MNINTKLFLFLPLVLFSLSVIVKFEKLFKNSLLQLWLDGAITRNLTSYCLVSIVPISFLIFSFISFDFLSFFLPFPFYGNSSSSFIKTFPRSRSFPRTLLFHLSLSLSRHDSSSFFTLRLNTHRDTRRYKLDDFRNSHAMEMIHLARNTSLLDK